MGILIAEAVRLKGMGTVHMEDFGIMGTDISSDALSKAMQGKYSTIDVGRGLPLDLRDRYFILSGDSYYVKEDVRKLMDFKSLNIQDPFTQIGGFDVIFCRNILIYFTNEAKKKILSQFYQILAPGGYLLLGSAENVYNLNDDFKTERYGATTLYRKN